MNRLHVAAVLALLVQGCLEEEPEPYQRLFLFIDAPDEGEEIRASSVRVRGRVYGSVASVTWTCGGSVGECEIIFELAVPREIHSWYFDLPLPLGTHTAEIRALSLDGSSATDQVTFERVPS